MFKEQGLRCRSHLAWFAMNLWDTRRFYMCLIRQIVYSMNCKNISVQDVVREALMEHNTQSDCDCFWNLLQ